MTISKDEEQAFDKIHHYFLIKLLERIGLREIYANIIKVIYNNPRANIILNGEKLIAISKKLEKMQG